MKDHLFLALVLCLCTSQHVDLVDSFEMDNIGRVVRGHLGTLYDLRSKLGAPPSTSERPVVPQPPLQSASSRRYSQRVVEIRTETPVGVTKESRGYAYHYSPTEVKNPIYSQDFQSSKPSSTKSSSSSSGKWKKKGERDWDKYVKRGRETSTTEYQMAPAEPTTTTSTTTTTLSTSAPPVTAESKLNLPVAVPDPATPTLSFPSFGSVGPFATFTQGLNHAMTTVLTQKLMNIIDQDAPEGILKPMRDVVATGGRMIDFWDKRTNARDGKNPGILELMGYGMDQLKKFKDGGELKRSDVVGSNTTPSKTLIEGLVTIKKLTNRVLGYDTDMEAVMMESRDGHGGGGGHGWGWGGGGHHVSYGHSNHLDPFSLLAALAFGAFLLQLLLTLYNTSARSLDVTDINTPLLMSDYYMPKIMSAADKIFGTPTVRTKRSADGDDQDDSTFGSIIDKLDGLFKSYNHVSEKPKCIRLYMCRLAVQDVMGDANSVLSRLYMYGLEHLSSDKSTRDFIESIQDKVIAGENVDCNKQVKECMPDEIANT